MIYDAAGNKLRDILFAYNATGNQVTETLYMTRLAPTAHNPDVRPAAPAGERA